MGVSITIWALVAPSRRFHVLISKCKLYEGAMGGGCGITASRRHLAKKGLFLLARRGLSFLVVKFCIYHLGGEGRSGQPACILAVIENACCRDAEHS